MTHQCHDCKNFTDGKCCHELKICLSNSAKNETQTDLSIESGSQFKVGDYVVAKDTYKTNELFQIERKGSFGGMYDTKWRLLDLRQFRHATPAEIKAGHRINFNLNDTIATAFDDLGDDKNIENHVAPQCKVGGDE